MSVLLVVSVYVCVLHRASLAHTIVARPASHVFRLLPVPPIAYHNHHLAREEGKHQNGTEGAQGAGSRQPGRGTRPVPGGLLCQRGD